MQSQGKTIGTSQKCKFVDVLRRCINVSFFSRNHEDDKNFQLALETFEKVLQIEPDHVDAKEGIWHMRKKIMGVTDRE